MELISCGTCGEPIEILKPYHWPKKRFCSPKCKKRAQRARYKMEKRKTPDFKCPECGFHTRLAFRPTVTFLLWKAFSCPKCGMRPCPANDNSFDEDLRRSIKEDPV